MSKMKAVICTKYGEPKDALKIVEFEKDNEVPYTFNGLLSIEKTKKNICI
jgi:hypothetical protein